MAYTPPSGNITSAGNIFTWINGLVGDWFFTGIIIAIYFIILVKLMVNNDDSGKAFASASFICMILSILLRTANLVSTTFMVIFIITTAIGGVWMHVENARYSG